MKNKLEINIGDTFGNKWEILEEYTCAEYAAIAGHSVKNHHFKCVNHMCGIETYLERTTVRKAIEREQNKQDCTFGKCKGCIDGNRAKDNTCHYANIIRDHHINKIPDRAPTVNVGDVFGIFEVLEIEGSGSYVDSSCRAKVRCNRCGRITTYRFDPLRKLQAVCECNKSHSSGEMLIVDYCERKGLLFSTEVVFDNLTGMNGGALRYDIALLNPTGKVIGLIEFDGDQHYEPYSFFGGEEGLNKLRTHDEIKNMFAASCGIPLCRLTEKDRSNIDVLLDNFIKKEVEKEYVY